MNTIKIKQLINEILIEVENKPKMVQVNLKKLSNFTTNKNYLGHCDGVAYYQEDSLLPNNQKEITGKEPFEKLADGFYNVDILNVYENMKDDGKKVLVFELKLPNGNKYYHSYKIFGYNEMTMKIANENVAKLISNFGIVEIEEAKGKKGVLRVLTNDKGFKNEWLNPEAKNRKY